MWDLALVLRIQCPFDFSFYPFDGQDCSVKFTSFFHTDNVVKYKTWHLEDISDKVQQALGYDIEYEIISNKDDLIHKYHPCDERIYSVSGFNVKLKRNLGPAIMTIFVPSLITVIIAFCR